MFTQKGNYILQYLFFITAACCLASCENNMKTVNRITASDKNLQDVEKNASVFYNDSAKTKFHLTAPRIESYGGPDPYIVFPKGIHIDFYDDSSHINGQLDADYAIRHENSKLMEADNNVSILNNKGERLNTEQLFWDANKEKIYTNKFVRIKTAKQIIYGDGLISNEDFTQYKITNIRGTIQLDNPVGNDKDKK